MKSIAVIGGTGINNRVPGWVGATNRSARCARGLDYNEHVNLGRQLPAIYAVKGA